MKSLPLGILVTALLASTAVQAQQRTVTLQASDCFHDGAEITAELVGDEVIRWRLDAFTSLSRITMDLGPPSGGARSLTFTQAYRDGTRAEFEISLSADTLAPRGMVGMDWAASIDGALDTFNEFYSATQTALRSGEGEMRCRRGEMIR